MDDNEYETLAEIGWEQEGVGWYGVDWERMKSGSSSSDDSTESSTSSTSSSSSSSSSSSTSTHTHSYTSTVTKAATCTEQGTRTYTCSCGKSYTRPIAATGHSWDTSNVTWEWASDYSSATATAICAVCGISSSAEATITSTVGTTYTTYRASAYLDSSTYVTTRKTVTTSTSEDSTGSTKEDDTSSSTEEDDATYTIYYDANGGTGAPSTQTGTYTNGVTLSSTKPTRTGYTFLGWSTSSTATVAEFTAGETIPASSSLATSTSTITLYAVWELTPTTYSYEVYYLDDMGSTWYSDSEAATTRVLYVKTDNPDASFYIAPVAASEYVGIAIYSGYTYLDIEVDESVDTSSFVNNYTPVEGGYIVIVSIGFDEEVAGTEFDLRIYEDSGSMNLYGTSKTCLYGPTITITLASFEDATNAWADAIIAEYTTSSMDAFEKMEAIVAGLKSSYTYLYNNGSSRRYLASDPDYPYFVSHRWDSATSPEALALIAERLGVFDEIDNMYDNYSRSTTAWKTWHSYVAVTLDGETRYYSACPLTSSGYIDPDDVDTIDLSNTSALIRASN